MAIAAGRSLEGQQTIFNFRLYSLLQNVSLIYSINNIEILLVKNQHVMVNRK